MVISHSQSEPSLQTVISLFGIHLRRSLLQPWMIPSLLTRMLTRGVMEEFLLPAAWSSKLGASQPVGGGSGGEGEGRGGGELEAFVDKMYEVIGERTL